MLYSMCKGRKYMPACGSFKSINKGWVRKFKSTNKKTIGPANRKSPMCHINGMFTNLTKVFKTASANWWICYLRSKLQRFLNLRYWSMGGET
jgi:hypothetical protein